MIPLRDYFSGHLVGNVTTVVHQRHQDHGARWGLEKRVNTSSSFHPQSDGL